MPYHEQERRNVNGQAFKAYSTYVTYLKWLYMSADHYTVHWECVINARHDDEACI